MRSPDPWSVMQPGFVPEAYYGHPFYREVPSWLTRKDLGAPADRQRQLFDGAFVGADWNRSATMRPYIGAEAQRGDLTTALAPAIAPATGGITFRKELDDKQVLHVEICVDGKCHKASMDLAPAIALVMQKMAQWHASQHSLHDVPSTVVVGAVDSAVAAAGDAMVASLLDRHVTIACSGFLDDIGSALKGAATSVYHDVANTVQELKGPITAAATTAATSLGGPLAGAAAAKLVGPVIDTAANFGKPTPAKAAAEQAAKTDPQAAAALQTAKQAAAHTIAAYHVTATAQKAAAGHPVAQRQIAQLAQDAERGDPMAHAAVPLVANAFGSAVEDRRGSYQHHASRAVARALQQYQQQYGRIPAAIGYLRVGQHGKEYMFNSGEEAHAWYGSLSPDQYSYAAVFDARNPAAPVVENFGSATTAVSGWVDLVGAWPWLDIVGSAIDDVRKQATVIAAKKSGNAVGVIHTVDGTWHALAFRSSDDADDWFGRAIAEPSSFTYAAYYEKDASGVPYLQNEQIGGARPASVPGPLIPRGPATTGAWPWYDVVSGCFC